MSTTTVVASLQHLNWDSHKKCFNILGSVDRKILSFLFNSVGPSCGFYGYPDSVKEFSDFKPLFLRSVSQYHTLHLATCPENFKQTLNDFYINLLQQVSELNIENGVSEQDSLLRLQQVCTDCFRKLVNGPPLNMPQISFSEENPEYLRVLTKGQCYHYALYLAKEYKALLSMSSLESPCRDAFLLYPKYFLQSLGYSETQTPEAGDLVLYLGNPREENKCRFKHLGMMAASQRVKSAWGTFSHKLEHHVFQVPYEYGSEVIFLRKDFPAPETFGAILSTTNQISNLILYFNNKVIPAPLTNLGIVVFLTTELKQDCEKIYPGSKEWDWKMISKTALEAIDYSNLKCANIKRVEFIKEFQYWMEEVIPEHYASLQKVLLQTKIFDRVARLS